MYHNPLMTNATPSAPVSHPYHLLRDGEHVASFAHFGDANRAAFDDLPGFEPFEAPSKKSFDFGFVETSVVCTGLCLARYELNRGRLAVCLDPSEPCDSLPAFAPGHS